MEESKQRKWKTSDSITVGIWTTVLLIISVMITLILTHVLGFNPPPDSSVSIPIFIDNGVIKRVFNGNGINPNHKVDCDSHLENKTPSTNSYYNLEYFPTYNSTSNEVPTSIVCFIYEKDSSGSFNRSNFFPVFVFDDVVKELSTHMTTDYYITNANNQNNFALKNEGQKRQYLKAQKNARIVTSYLLNKTSFGSEISLLDVVYFSNNVTVEGNNALGVYTSQSTSSHLLKEQQENNVTIAVNNKRLIRLLIEETIFQIGSLDDEYTGEKEELQIPINYPVTLQTPTLTMSRKLAPGSYYNKEGYEGISFNLNQLGQTFVHEYGHHLTLFSNQKEEDGDGQELLNKIVSVFPFTNSQQRIDFYNLYNYFNSAPTGKDTSVLFSTSAIQETKATYYDLRYLEILRRYTSSNVVSLRGLFSDTYITSRDGYWRHNKYLIFKNIVDNKLVNTDLQDRLKKLFVKEIPAGETEEVWFVDKDEYNAFRKSLFKDNTIKTQYFFKDDIGSIVTSIKDGDNELVNMYPISNSYSSLEESEISSDDSVTVGSVFPNIQPTGAELYTNGEYTCKDAPYDLITGSYLNTEAVMLNNILQKETEEITYEIMDEASDKADVEYLKLMQYHFSYSELLARLFSLLSYTQEDYNLAVDACAIDIEEDPITKEVSLSRRDVPSSELLEDYGFFRMFGMNVFESEEVSRTLSGLIKDDEKVDTLNKIVFKNNKYSTGVARDEEKETKLFYSHNMNGVDLPNSDSSVPNQNTEIKGSNTVYMLAHVKILDSSDIENITIEFTSTNGQKEYRTTYSYDFNHRITTIPGSTRIFDGTLQQQYVDEYGEELKKTHFEVVFKIDTIQLRVNTGSSYNAPFNNEYQSRSALEAAFSNITRVFIDKNKDGIFNLGETSLSL